MTVSEILSAAADLIEPEGAWTQNAMARSERENEVPFDSRNAVCWCIYGALEKVSDGAVPAGVFSPLSRALGGALVSIWNDAPERTQAEVVSKLREAAEKAREAVR